MFQVWIQRKIGYVPVRYAPAYLAGEYATEQEAIQAIRDKSLAGEFNLYEDYAWYSAPAEPAPGT